MQQPRWGLDLTPGNSGQHLSLLQRHRNGLGSRGGGGGRAFDADFLNARMYPHVTLTPAPRPCNDGLLVINRPLLCLLVIVWASVSLPLTGRHELLRLTRVYTHPATLSPLFFLNTAVCSPTLTTADAERCGGTVGWLT